MRYLIESTNESVVVVDCLTYAGNLESLAMAAQSSRYNFVQANICDANAMAEVFTRYQPTAVMHLAAKSHVDRSIYDPAIFMQNNIMGTFTLLEAVRKYWNGLYDANKDLFRFLHVSTDEVYGDLYGVDDKATEELLISRIHHTRHLKHLVIILCVYGIELMVFLLFLLTVQIIMVYINFQKN